MNDLYAFKAIGIRVAATFYGVSLLSAYQSISFATGLDVEITLWIWSAAYITCSKLKIEILEQGVKYVQS